MKNQYVVEVQETPSPRVTLQRKVLASKVRAVFIPNNPASINQNAGVWLLGKEVETGLKLLQNQKVSPIIGIVYVPEDEPSLLVMQAGMTAAESTQYYPPLPCDRSYNHYNASQSRAGPRL